MDIEGTPDPATALDLPAGRVESVVSDRRPDADLDSHELVEVIAHCNSIIAAATHRMIVAASLVHQIMEEDYNTRVAQSMSGQSDTVEEFATAVVQRRTGADPLEEFGPTGFELATTDIGAVLTRTPAEARELIIAGDRARYRLEFTGGALATGRIDYRRYQIAVKRTERCTPEKMHDIDVHLAAEIENRPPMSITRFTTLVDTIITEHDRVSVREQRRRAQADRDVTIGPDRFHPGQSSLRGKLPTTDAAELKARLDAMATSVHREDPRTAPQRRHDSFLALSRGDDHLTCLCDACTITDTDTDTPINDADATIGDVADDAGHHTERDAQPTPESDTTESDTTDQAASQHDAADEVDIDADLAPNPHHSAEHHADSVEPSADDTRTTADEASADEASADKASGDDASAGELTGTDESGDAARPVPPADSALPESPPTPAPEPASPAVHPPRPITPVQPTFHIVVNLSTLLNLDDHPAFCDGQGIIDADTARDLLAEATRHYVDPRLWNAAADHTNTYGTGNGNGNGNGHDCDDPHHHDDDPAGPVHTPPDAAHWSLAEAEKAAAAALNYTPSKKLQSLVRAGELCCTFPGCNAPVWLADLDHTTPFNHNNPHAGGPTTARNLKPLCRFHHRMKTFSDWRDYQDPYGRAYFLAPNGHMFLGNAFNGRDLFGRHTPKQPDDHPARVRLEHLRTAEVRRQQRHDDKNPPPF